mmetsp:Transcript_28171/g.81002  ORF Transcript_28171/g.81002 Transcript_28171/m.81002 type:complete len:243 (-) Transcript_28171:140-868(-)
MAEDEGEQGPKPNKAKVDDEFLRHPHSGAFIRNPLLDKTRTTPISFAEGEFKHNCLEEALTDYNFVMVSENSYREMMRMGKQLAATQTAKSDQSQTAPPGSPFARAALSTLTKTSHGYEFVVNLRKSTYIPPRAGRRRQDTKPSVGVLVDKLNIEVNDDKEGGLKIEDIKEGLVAAWNRTQHSAFQVKVGDRIVRANARGVDAATPQQIQEELEKAPDLLRLVVRRPAMERRPSLPNLALAA